MSAIKKVIGAAAPIAGGLIGGAFGNPALGAAIGSGVSGIIGAGSAEDAARQASGAQLAGTQAGIDEQRRQFDVTQANLQPFQEAGVNALAQQQALLGLSGQEEQQGAFNALAESPGQRFMRERQQRALLRNQSAIGGLGGGNVRTALQEQAAGFAQQDLQNQFGRLGQLAGQGQSAVTNLGQFGSAAAGNIQQGLQSAGQARATGIQGANQAQQQFGQIGAQLAGRIFG